MRACRCYGLFLVLFLIFLLTVNPSVPPAGNSGELIISGWMMGIPHPTGYSSYTVLSKGIMMFMPFGNIGYRGSIFSALTMSIGLTLLFHFFTRLNGGKIFVPFLVIVFMTTIKTVWDQAVMPEIYALHLLYVSIAFLIIQQVAERGKLKHILLLAFTCGLGMTNHLLFGFIFPYLLVMVGFRVYGKNMLKQPLVLLGTMFLLGYSMTIYLPIRSSLDPVLDWGNPQSLQTCVAHVTGSQFHGNMFSLPWVVVLRNLNRVVSWGWENLSIWMLVMFVAGTIFSWKKKTVQGSFVTIVILVFAISNYDIPDIENYYVMVLVFFSIVSFHGFQLFFRIIANKRFPVGGIVGILLVMVMHVQPFTENYVVSNRKNMYLGKDFGVTLFESVVYNGLIFTRGDLPNNILGYLYLVEKYRPDTKFMDITGNFFTNSELTQLMMKIGDPSVFFQRILNINDGYLYTTFWPGEDKFYGMDIYQSRMLYQVGYPPLNNKDLQQVSLEILPLRGLYSGKVWKDPSTKELVCEYFIYKANWYHRKKCFTKSMEMFDQAAMYAGDIPRLHARVAFFLDQAGWNKRAVEEYIETIRLDPYYPDALNNLANIYYKRYGRLDEALELVMEALKYVPRGVQYNALRIEYMDTLANIYEWNGKYQEAIEIIHEIQVLDRARKTGYENQLKSLEKKVGEPRLKNSIGNQARLSPEFHLQNALIFKQLGYLQESIREYETALKYSPKDIDLMSNLALGYFQVGWLEKGAVLCEKILQEQPGNIKAHQMLGYYFEEIHQPEKALTHLQQLMDQKLLIKDKVRIAKHIKSLEQSLVPDCI